MKTIVLAIAVVGICWLLTSPRPATDDFGWAGETPTIWHQATGEWPPLTGSRDKGAK